MHPKTLFDLAKKSVTAWIDDYAPSMGAAIAYYTVFSLAPLLIIVIAVAGMVFGREAVEGQIVAQLDGLIGREGAIGVQALIRSASEPAKGIIATAISVVVLVIGATTVFGELQSALDRIWRVPAAEKTSGIWNLLRARLLSFGLILGLGFLMLVSTVISAAVSAFGTWANDLLPASELLLRLINSSINIGMSTLLFAMIYKIMPQAKIAWRDVWTGAAVTAVLFELGRILIGLYIGKSGITSSFAAAGSLVVLLVWVYYSAQVFLLGAEFTWVFAQHHGSHAAEPTPPVPVEVPDRETGGVEADPPTSRGKRALAPPSTGRPAVPRQPAQEALALGALIGAQWLLARFLKSRGKAWARGWIRR